MASSLLALIDDVASILDDVAVLTKIAAKKTSGVIGDDLALNVQQMNGGINPDKELKVIFAVAKGAFVNKLILVPVAILISYFIPSLITPLLMLGGAFLCFEGVEKVLEKIFHSGGEVKEVVATCPQEAQLQEKEKIKGAIRTDFILSAEIIVISLGAIAHGSLISRIFALAIISILMTVGVYGLVALILKLDDMGIYLLKKTNKVSKTLGLGLINTAPVLMKILGVVGTIAMFLVGGGIISHGIHVLGDLSKDWPVLGTMAYEGAIGIVCGLILVGLLNIVKKIKSKVQ